VENYDTKENKEKSLLVSIDVLGNFLKDTRLASTYHHIGSMNSEVIIFPLKFHLIYYFPN